MDPTLDQSIRRLVVSASQKKRQEISSPHPPWEPLHSGRPCKSMTVSYCREEVQRQSNDALFRRKGTTHDHCALVHRPSLLISTVSLLPKTVTKVSCHQRLIVITTLQVVVEMKLRSHFPIFWGIIALINGHINGQMASSVTNRVSR